MVDRQQFRRQVDQLQSRGLTSGSVRLSCELCRQRKVKCDKLTPCTNCQRIGASCVHVERARLPRGRTRRTGPDASTRSDTELSDRVARIEQLLGELIHEDGQEDLSNIATSQTPSFRNGVRNKASTPEFKMDETGSSQNSNVTAVNSNLETQRHGSSSSGTWAGPAYQTEGDMQDAIMDRRWDSQLRLSDRAAGYDASLIGLISPQNPLSTMLHYNSGIFASSHVRKQLCQIYLDQVDPVFKILHRPSLSEFLLEDKPYLEYDPGHPAPTALACAVFYAAVCSLTDEKCFHLFGENKKSVIVSFQRETEAALVRADVITTDDSTVLQAYILSLVSSRSQEQSRRVWTMLSLALRVAQALSLHHPDPPFPLRPFEREMRNRLFQAIGFLDVQASLDRASEPMMRADWLQPVMPFNVNDCDITLNMQGPVQDSHGITDMTFTMIISKAQYVMRSLNFSEFSEPGVKYLRMRQQLVRDFQKTTSDYLYECQPDSINFHWFTKKAAECINASLQLIVLRPLQRNVNFTPPRIKETAGLLKLAVDVLQKTEELRTDPRGSAWRWFDGLFIPWHALAVAIAELCVCENFSLMEAYYPVVEEGYGRFSDTVTDYQQRMLWGPMEKIMARARTKKDELLAAHGPSYATVTSSTDANSFQVLPSGNVWRPQSSLTPIMDHGIGNQNQVSTPTTLPGPCNWLDLWPELWDATEIGCAGVDELRDSSWLNYEMFMEDLYGSDVSFSMPV